MLTEVTSTLETVYMKIWVDVTSVNFNSKKSQWRWNFRSTRYITIFLRRIQRLQICKISTDVRGTLSYVNLSNPNPTTNPNPTNPNPDPNLIKTHSNLNHSRQLTANSNSNASVPSSQEALNVVCCVGRLEIQIEIIARVNILLWKLNRFLVSSSPELTRQKGGGNRVHESSWELTVKQKWDLQLSWPKINHLGFSHCFLYTLGIQLESLASCSVFLAVNWPRRALFITGSL